MSVITNAEEIGGAANYAKAMRKAKGAKYLYNNYLWGFDYFRNTFIIYFFFCVNFR